MLRRMPLQIIGSPDDVAAELRSAIESAIPGARVDVAATGPGHFEISVISEAFGGKSVLQQQQLVYGAIRLLMAGESPRVHAIDRMQTRLP